ncbi:type IV pilin protein [Candidatus Avelusimicrobium luingense]|uniref:type IV pilin protein n=1 Tax=Candidatus Avelusimicrobium luingense TaxID=3416211 RepID=UPI003D0A9B53
MENNRAFTLIELLVVVLIIGILAAVALPQYNKAVLKSRVAQVLSYMKTVKNAEEVYYLANGTYTADMEEIAVEGGLPSGWTLELIATGVSAGTVHANMYQGSTLLMDIVTSFDHRSDKPEWAGMTYCYVPKNTMYEKVCKSYGSVLPNGDDGSYIRYQIY